LSLDIEVKHKKMTRFLCQELLYEYVSGVLDTRRQEDVREHLAECKESQRELEKLKKGLAFSQQASHLQVSPKLHQALLNFEPQWQKQLREWTLWSSERGWKMLPYAFITLTIVLGLVVAKPWKRQEAPEITLAEQLQKEPDMIAQDQGKPVAAPVTTPEDATKPAPVEAKPAEIPLAADVAVAASAVMINTTSPNVLPKPEVAQLARTQPSTQKAPKPTEIINEPGEERSKEPISGMRGWLTRGEIDVNDFSNSWQAIRDKIIALNGKVAGSVELGWLRRPDQAYFHFTLPESNYSELELYLSTFGPVRFSKERHPRVMPEGQIRIILTVKDAVTHESGETP
jgi:anti-sigma factor RsiW